jgi:predicted Zn-dependent protease
MIHDRHRRGLAVLTLSASAFAFTAAPAAYAHDPKPGFNVFSADQEVQLGQQAAADAERQLPMLNDRSVTTYVNNIVGRLARVAPHRDYPYQAKVVNSSDINAFALPGGFIYVHRGLIQAARTEGELAGVLAHEISHVALRHGTAQASRATPFALGALAGAVAGALIGGDVGSIVSQGTQFGLGTWFLSYSREFEREADILGAQIMARTGYDPREAAGMFETLERANGGGGLEFLSSHPDPGNRSERIIEEARLLGVQDGTTDTAAFRRIKARLADMPEAPTTAQVTEN